MKTHSKVLVLLLLLLALPAAVQAQFTFTTNNGAITITKYTGPDGAVAIPSATNGLPVTSLGSYAFDECFNVTNVTIPDSVTNLGDGAFFWCDSLTSVTLGDGVTNIGDSAFRYCTSLASVSLPDHVISIGTNAFDHCASLTSVAIPNSVTSIGPYAFSECGALASITLGSGVTSIGDEAFAWCHLTSVTIPSGVTNIGSAAFYWCLNLAAIMVDTNNPAYSSVDGVLFDKSQTTLIQYPAGKTGSSYTIPDSVTSIGDWAFSECSGLTSVTIANTVTSIGYEAFYYCTRLASVMIGNHVTSIEQGAFTGCSLTSVTLPNSVTNIGSVAFYGSSLTDVYFQGNAPGLGANVFNDYYATLYYLPGTLGWTPQVQTSDASFGVRTNGFGFTISGTSGLGIVVEACTNLANPSWSPVQTITLAGGSAYFSDSQWANYPSRFYRLLTSTFGGLPVVLWNPQVQTADASFGVRTNGFGFTITGTSNLVVVVEACTNLANPIWSPVGTNILTGGSSYFSDPQWANYPARLYRLRSP